MSIEFSAMTKEAYDARVAADAAKLQNQSDEAEDLSQTQEQFTEVVSRFHESEAWQERGACKGLGLVDTELFFGPSHSGERKEIREAREAKAREYCASCVVKAECLDYAIRRNEEWGIWGGLDKNQRKRFAKTGEAVINLTKRTGRPRKRP